MAPPNYHMPNAYKDERRSSYHGSSNTSYHGTASTYRPESNRDRDRGQDRPEPPRPSMPRRDSRDLRDANRGGDGRSPQDSRRPRDDNRQPSLRVDTGTPSSRPVSDKTNSPASNRSASALPRVSPKEACGLNTPTGDTNGNIASTISKPLALPKAKDPALQPGFEMIYSFAESLTDRASLQLLMNKADQEDKKRQLEADKMKTKASLHGPYQDISARPTPRGKKLQKQRGDVESRFSVSCENLVSHLAKIGALNVNQPTPPAESSEKATQLAQSQIQSLENQLHSFRQDLQGVVEANKAKATRVESLEKRLETVEAEHKVQINSLKQENKEAKEEIQSLKSERNDMWTSLNSLKSSREDMWTSLDSLKSSREDMRTSLDSLKSSREDMRASLDSLKSSREDMRASLDSLKSSRDDVWTSLDSLKSSRESVDEHFRSMSDEISIRIKSLTSQNEMIKRDTESLKSNYDKMSHEILFLQSTKEQIEDLKHKLEEFEELDQTTIRYICEGWYDRDHNLKTLLDEYRKYRQAGFPPLVEGIQLLHQRIEGLQHDIKIDSVRQTQKDDILAAGGLHTSSPLLMHEKRTQQEQGLVSLEKAHQGLRAVHSATSAAPLINRHLSTQSPDSPDIPESQGTSLDEKFAALESTIHTKTQNHLDQVMRTLGDMFDEHDKRLSEAVGFGQPGESLFVKLRQIEERVDAVTLELDVRRSKDKASENKLLQAFDTVRGLRTDITDIQQTTKRLETWVRSIHTQWDNLSTKAMAEHILKQVDPRLSHIERLQIAQGKTLASHNDLLRAQSPHIQSPSPGQFTIDDRSKKRKLESNGRSVSSPLQSHQIPPPPP